MSFFFFDPKHQAKANEYTDIRLRSRTLRRIADLFYDDPDAFEAAMVSIGVVDIPWRTKLPFPKLGKASYRDEDLISLLADAFVAHERDPSLTVARFAIDQHAIGRTWGDRYSRQEYRSAGAMKGALYGARRRCDTDSDFCEKVVREFESKMHYGDGEE